MSQPHEERGRPPAMPSGLERDPELEEYDVPLPGAPEVLREGKRSTPLATVRARVTYALLGIIATMVIGGFVAVVIGGAAPAEARALLDVIFVPVVTLTATAVGYYFAEHG